MQESRFPAEGKIGKARHVRWSPVGGGAIFRSRFTGIERNKIENEDRGTIAWRNIGKLTTPPLRLSGRARTSNDVASYCGNIEGKEKKETLAEVFTLVALCTSHLPTSHLLVASFVFSELAKPLSVPRSQTSFLAIYTSANQLTTIGVTDSAFGRISFGSIQNIPAFS